jgi:predicted dithiol-disulfide oxidoreductase (DUF899 family)
LLPMSKTLPSNPEQRASRFALELATAAPDETGGQTCRTGRFPEDWLKARLELLAAEKELTCQRDALTGRRMAMPWERVEKPYSPICSRGRKAPFSLADLFYGRSQFMIYHFIFAPDWEEGCKSCSIMAENCNGS